MAISDNGTRDQYSASASQTVFAYTFEVFVKEDLAVEQNGTLLSEGTHYTVSDVGNDAGGNVTLVTGATLGDIITLYRSMAFERLSDYQQNGEFLANEVNSDLDRLWAALQQNQTNLGASIRPAIDDSVLNSSNTELANVVTRGGKALGFANDGTLDYKSFGTAGGSFIDASTTGTMAGLSGLSVGDVVQTAEFSTGNGGGGTYDVVLTSSVTPNTYDIIIGVAEPLISFVIRRPEVGLSSASVGVVHDNSTENAPSLKNWALLGDRLLLSAGIALSDTAEIDFSVNGTKLIQLSTGRIKSSGLDTEDLLTVSGDDIVFTGVEVEGVGTFVEDGSTQAALIKVTGDRFTQQLGKEVKPPTVGTFLNASLGSTVQGVYFEGGPTSDALGVAHFGVRAIDSYKSKVQGCWFMPESGGGQVTTGVFVSSVSGGTDIDQDTDVAMHDFIVSNNYFSEMNDHAIYYNAVLRGIITNNICKYINNTGITVGHSFNASTKRQGNIVTNNQIFNCLQDSAFGIHLRDANNCTASDNIIDTCANGIQVGPVNHSGPLDGNIVSNNQIINYSRYGIQFIKVAQGQTITSCNDNEISNNIIDTGAVNAGDMDVEGRGINFTIPQTAATNIAARNRFTGNKILGAPNYACAISNSDLCEFEDNFIYNVGLATGATNRAGLLSQNNTQITIENNKIHDSQGSPTMQYGIEGGNNTVSSTIKNNEFSGNTSLAIRQFQQSSHNNTFLGNRINTDTTTGTVTLGASATTVVTNNNARDSGGYTNHTNLIPLNASAATLMAGALRPYRSTEIADTSFTIATADGSAAAGTEEFYYEIIG